MIVDRDRMREKERQARAQMSSAAEREADAAGPLFGGPIRFAILHSYGKNEYSGWGGGVLVLKVNVCADTPEWLYSTVCVFISVIAHSGQVSGVGLVVRGWVGLISSSKLKLARLAAVSISEFKETQPFTRPQPRPYRLVEAPS
ncbi:hypothetical protein J6590_050330 [Homalodisca vitripennis]|nr:hypothetical protein J6590_050330 [Homalodisca vitripennis]